MKAKKPVSAEVRREIEVRAYLIWESEGRPHGREIEHWNRAEAEILATATAPKPEKKVVKSTSKTANAAAKAVVAAKAKKPAKGKSHKAGQHHS